MLRALWPILALLSTSTAALAQVEEKKFLEEERRRQMEERQSIPDDLWQSFLLDFGAWIHSQVAQMDDNPERSERTLRYYDFRLWAEALLERRYRLFIRLQSQYTDFNSGDQFEGEDDGDYRIALVDQAYLDVDGGSPGADFHVRLGRHFFSLGRGLLLNNVAYGVLADLDSGRHKARAFAAHTIPQEDDVDGSLPNSDDSRRGFAGVELGYLMTAAHRVYLMGMIERDFNRENPKVAGQDWDYDASYLGGGLRGTLVGDLGYAIEGVYEFGHGVAAGTTSDENIRAWALTVTLDMPLGGPEAPTLAAEYMYGSGDPDRGSVTDTSPGNAPGTRDEGFLSFGFVHTGYALFPRLSNIHILRAGGSIRPLGATDAFRTLEIGLFGYLYRKDEETSPISDPNSALPDEDVGTAIDATVRWRLLSDVALFVNYGRFMPGDAYVERQDRDFYNAGITYSF